MGAADPVTATESLDGESEPLWGRNARSASGQTLRRSRGCTLSWVLSGGNRREELSTLSHALQHIRPGDG